MTLGSSNIYWEESIHTEGKSDRKQEDLPTLQHQQVVNWVSECELRSQNMKKLLGAMSSFEVSVKSVESTIYSTSLIFTRASWLEWWKWLQTLVKQARKRPLLWWRYFLLLLFAASSVKLCRAANARLHTSITAPKSLPLLKCFKEE